MAERTGDYQEEVLADLLDLQAELRGETRHDVAATPAVSPEEDAHADVVTVATSGLQVSVAPSGAAVTERLVALNERLARLEESLANVTRRIEGVETESAAVEEASDDDAPWRSFIDLQKIVADRLDRR